MQLHIYISMLYLIVFAAPTLADVQEFENEQRPEFFEAIGGESNVTTIGFTEFPNNTTISTQYTGLGVEFEGTNFVSGPFPISYHDGWGLRIFNGNDLYFDEPINWIAADFIGTMSVELYDGNNVIYTGHFGSGGLDEFAGLISGQPFDRVLIYDAGDFLTVLDDLHFGPPIPAPGVLAPFGLIFVTHKRRARTS